LAKTVLAGAVSAVSRCLAAMESLAETAFGCSVAPEADRLGIDLKQSLFKTRKGNRDRVLFVVIAETVPVVAVRGAGQDDVTAADIQLPE
jgi:hypothetical protein